MSQNNPVATVQPERGTRPQIIEWRPARGDGIATVGFGWLTIATIPIFRAPDGSLGVGVPRNPSIDAEGRCRTGQDGKRLYTPIIGFANATGRDRWKHTILTALAEAGIGGAQ